jgi:hypothetical protein
MKSTVCSLIPDALSAQWEVWFAVWYLIHCPHNEKYGLHSNTWYTVCTMRSMVCSLIPDTLSAQWEVWAAVWYLLHCLHNEKYGLQSDTWYTVCTMRSMVCSLIPDTLSAQWEVWSAVWYLIHCLHNEEYGLQSDTWYTVCTMRSTVCSLITDTLSAQWEVITCDLMYRSCFKFCLQLWDRGCVSTRRSSCIVWGICHTVVEHDNSIVSTWSMMFGHWIPYATASDMCLKKERYQTIYCVIFQTYCVTRNQIKGTLCVNLFPFSIIFHVELVRITSNN